MIRKDNVRDTEMLELKIKKKLHKSKTYNYNTGRDLLDRKMDITFREGMEISPVIKQQVIKAT